jgi:hypothetical protein
MLHFEHHLEGHQRYKYTMADNKSNDGGNKVPKIRAPERVDPKKFLMQCDIYFQLRSDDLDEEANKVLFVAACLRDAAASWVEPMVYAMKQICRSEG